MQHIGRLAAVAALLLAWMGSPSHAQRYPFTVYTIDDGLAQSQPTALLQDSGGYLWVGTYGGGLSRFDGRKFHTYKPSDGLLGGNVMDFAEDSSGTVWISTRRGLNYFDGHALHTYDLGLGLVNIPDLMVDAHDNLWIATTGHGVVRYHAGSTASFTRTQGLASDSVHVLLTTSDGTLWAGTEQGLCSSVPATHHPAPETMTWTCLGADTGLQGKATVALAEDARGILWIGTQEGTFRYDGGTIEQADGPYGTSPTVSLLADPYTEGMWIGTSTELFYHAPSGAVRRFSLESGLAIGAMNALLFDRSGNLWIANDGFGLYRYTFAPFLLYDQDHGLPEPGAWSLTEDPNGDLWIGTHHHGLARFDGTTFTTYTTDQGLLHNSVYVTHASGDGTIWVGSRGGLQRFDGTTFDGTTLATIEALEGIPIWSMAEAADGGLWVGTNEHGVFHYKDDNLAQYTLADGLPSTSIYALHVTPDGTVWIGTADGLASYDGTAFTIYTVSDGLPWHEISALDSDAQGTLWLGTYGGGVATLQIDNRTGAAQIDVIADANGLSNNDVMSLVVEPGERVWVCTNTGLDAIDLDVYYRTGNASVTYHGPEEGFVGRECNSGASLLDRAGDLWFGTVRGIIRHTGTERPRPPYAPQTHLTQLRIFLEPIDWDASPYASGYLPRTALPTGLRLPHDQNHLTFNFIGIDLTAPLGVQYQYRLLGASEEWSPTLQETSASYANLSPGAYTFQVRAQSTSGVWNRESVELSFTIMPPYWQTSWFYALVTALLLALGFAALRLRERSVRYQQQLLTAMVNERTEALEREKQKVIAANQQLEQLSLVARETDNAVLIANAHGELEWVNAGMERLTGYTLAQLKATYGPRLSDISSNPGIEKMIAQALETGRSVSYETRVPTRHRGDRWMSSTLTPICDDAGTIRKLIVIDADITERKALEFDLIHAREAALSAARAKSAFLATMSHEIRTPMNGIIGMTTLLHDTPLNDEQQEFLTIIQNSGQTLLAIINDILDFSKLEASKVELEQVPFAVHELVEEALDVVAQRADAKNLTLACFFDDTVPTSVVGDVTRTRQVLTNLLSNAVKFTDEGSVQVTVSADPNRRDGPFSLRFTVADTGIGIPAQLQAKLFESFSQVDASTTRKYGGTGLGLAIAKQLTELMDGTIGVASTEGLGSTFTFSIRTEEAADLTDDHVADAARFAGRRALVSVDDPLSRKMLVAQLHAFGLEAIHWDTETTGETPAPAIVFMDVDDATTSLHAAQTAWLRTHLPDLPRIGLCRVGQRSEAHAEAYATILSKPVKRSYLRQVLQKYLSPATPMVTASTPHTPPPSSAPKPAPSALRILVAEDNVVNQKVALHFLQRLGYTAEVAANGHEAVAKCQATSYDLILMDVQMPEMDGLSATHRIREATGVGSAPWIIALTANVTPTDQAQCLDAGMNDFLAKPLRFNDLVSALERVPTSAAPAGP